MNTDKVEEILKSIGSEGVPADVHKIAEETSNNFSRSLMQSGQPRHYVLWEYIMKSGITKLAAAAVIIIAVLVGVYQFSGSLEGATAAFAKVREAIRNVPWMHISYTGHWAEEMGYEKSEDERLRREIWCSFESQIVIQKYADGVITYAEYSNQEIHTYNPVSRRIVISALPGGGLPLEPTSPWGWLEKDIQRMTQRGAEVARRIGRYAGKQVDVFEIVSRGGPNREAINGKIFVDMATSLPIAKEMRYFHPTGKLRRVVKGTFEYPEHGPADIYELGLPSETPLVNSLPLPPWKEIRQTYQSYRQKGPERFIAIVTRELPSLSYVPIETVDVFYSEGKRWREERHHVFGRGPVGVQWRQQAPEIGNTFDSILKWSQTYKASGGVSISLYDGDYIYNSVREDDGAWKAREEIHVGGRKLSGWGLCPVASLGWPQIRGAADVAQDDYARENNLIRVEVQGRQFYLNPDRDYICQRRTDGHVTDVTKFAQTEASQWYPMKIESRLSSKTVYLQTYPEFRDGIFDPNNLPK